MRPFITQYSSATKLFQLFLFFPFSHIFFAFTLNYKKLLLKIKAPASNQNQFCGKINFFENHLSGAESSFVSSLAHTIIFWRVAEGKDRNLLPNKFRLPISHFYGSHLHTPRGASSFFNDGQVFILAKHPQTSSSAGKKRFFSKALLFKQNFLDLKRGNTFFQIDPFAKVFSDHSQVFFFFLSTWPFQSVSPHGEGSSSSKSRMD